MSRKRLVEARSPEYALLGRKLAEARESLNLSQAEAAKLIGISQGTYSGYETGTRRVNLPMLKRIADAYNVEVDWLIGSSVHKADLIIDANSDIKLLVEICRNFDKRSYEHLIAYAKYLKEILDKKEG